MFNVILYQIFIFEVIVLFLIVVNLVNAEMLTQGHKHASDDILFDMLLKILCYPNLLKPDLVETPIVRVTWHLSVPLISYPLIRKCLQYTCGQRSTILVPLCIPLEYHEQHA